MVGPLLEVAMSKKCMPLWREAHFEVKIYKALGFGPLGGSDVEKVHVVVARSTFRNQNGKNNRGSDHFWRFRCRKNIYRCGAKAHFEIKILKTLGFGSFLEVQMSPRFTILHYTTLHSTILHYTPIRVQIKAEELYRWF